MTAAGVRTSAPILVTGATGRHGGTGAYLVRRLREVGRPVRVLVRRLDARVGPLQDLGAEVFVGDLHDRASLLPALDGVEAAYFTYPIGAGVVDAAATFAAAARQLGGRQRVVVMSMGASHPDSLSHLGRAQWLAEEVLAWASLDLLVLRVAALFHENLTMLHSRSIRDEGAFRNCFGDAAVPWINGEDAAALAAAALLHPGRFSGEAIHYPPGSELLSHAAVAALLGEELGRPVHFEPVARESWSDELVALAAAEPDSGVNADMAGHISAVGAMLAAPGRRPIQAPNADELGRLTGRPPISLRAFLHRERGRFDRLERSMEVGREPAGS